MDVKWIKITTDMFDDEKIDFIASLPEADAILIIWIRLLTLAGKANAGGYILLTEKIAYTDEMLAHKFKKPLNTVKLALVTLHRLDMVDYDGEMIYLPNWDKHQNIEGLSKLRENTRKRVQKHREKKKMLEEPTKCNVTVTDEVTPSNATELELDLELDKDLSTTTATDTIMDAYRKVFNTMMMNSFISEYVQKLLNQGYNEIFIKEVLYEVGESGDKPSLNFMKAIAERWIKEGISSREESKKRREEAKQNGKSYQQRGFTEKTRSSTESAGETKSGWQRTSGNAEILDNMRKVQ